MEVQAITANYMNGTGLTLGLKLPQSLMVRQVLSRWLFLTINYMVVHIHTEDCTNGMGLMPG